MKKYEVAKQYYLIQDKNSYFIEILRDDSGIEYHCLVFDNGIAGSIGIAMLSPELDKDNVDPIHKEFFSIKRVFIGHTEEDAIKHFEKENT